MSFIVIEKLQDRGNNESLDTIFKGDILRLIIVKILLFYKRPIFLKIFLAL